MGFRNTRKTNVVAPNDSLVDKEKYAVKITGDLVDTEGEFVYGIVSAGRDADYASEIIIYGECEAYCDGSTAEDGPISAGDGLKASTGGKLKKATEGTDAFHIVAKEDVTAASSAATVFIY